MDITKYENSLGNKKYLLYPGKNPKYLVIIFSCVGLKYNRAKQFWNDESWDNCSYLFLIEPRSPKIVEPEGLSLPWYMDYDNVIDHVSKNFESKNIITLGSSLGSFAALHHGIRMYAGISLVTAPAAPGLTFMNNVPSELKKYEDLKNRLLESSYLPDLYIESTEHYPDKRIIEEIIDIFLNKKSKVIFQKSLAELHVSVSLDDRNHVYRTIDYFLSWRDNTNSCNYLT